MATAFSLSSFLDSSLLDQSKAVAAGVPASALRELVDNSTLTLADLAKIVAPRRTLDRRLKENGNLSPDEGDRLARFASILRLCEHIFGGRIAAMHWLETPKHRFDGERPIDLIRTEVGAKLVEQLLVQAQHGMMA